MLKGKEGADNVGDNKPEGTAISRDHYDATNCEESRDGQRNGQAVLHRKAGRDKATCQRSHRVGQPGGNEVSRCESF